MGATARAVASATKHEWIRVGMAGAVLSGCGLSAGTLDPVEVGWGKKKRTNRERRNVEKKKEALYGRSFDRK